MSLHFCWIWSYIILVKSGVMLVKSTYFCGHTLCSVLWRSTVGRENMLKPWALGKIMKFVKSERLHPKSMWLWYQQYTKHWDSNGEMFIASSFQDAAMILNGVSQSIQAICPICRHKQSTYGFFTDIKIEIVDFRFTNIFHHHVQWVFTIHELWQKLGQIVLYQVSSNMASWELPWKVRWFCGDFPATFTYLVGGFSPTPLKNMSSANGTIVPYIWKNITCSKHPTRYTMENHHFQWVNPLFQWSCSIAILT